MLDATYLGAIDKSLDERRLKEASFMDGDPTTSAAKTAMTLTDMTGGGLLSNRELTSAIALSLEDIERSRRPGGNRT